MANSAHHLTDEQIAEIAVEGFIADPQGMDHLTECVSCRVSVEQMTRLTDMLSEPAEILAPPASLWDRIDESTREAPPHELSENRGRKRNRRQGRHIARRPLAVWGAGLAGTLVGTLLGGAAVVATSDLREDENQDSTPTVAAVGAADLEPVGPTDMHGQAVMEQTEDGQLELHVDVSKMARDGYLEVWLRDENATRLVSLGVVTSQSTTVDVPEGIDLNRYPVVDVSQENFDGDPTHGGETLIAGTMETKDA